MIAAARRSSPAPGSLPRWRQATSGNSAGMSATLAACLGMGRAQRRTAACCPLVCH